MRIKKYLSVLLAFLIIISCFNYNVRDVKADVTGSISIESKSATVGNDVSINVTVSSSVPISALYLNIKYNKNIVTPKSGYDAGGDGIIRKLDQSFDGTSKTYTFTFNVIQVGTSDISVDVASSYGVANDGETKIVFNNSSGKIEGKALPTYSSDNKLSSLSISPGNLSPAFSPDTTEYTATVGSDVSSVTVDAKTRDSKARVWVTDTYSNLNYGSNRIAVAVTAENGDVETYVIWVTRVGEAPTEETTKETETVTEANLPHAVVGGVTYNVVDKTESVPFPDGYVATTYNYHGDEVVVGKSDKTGLILMYLESSDSNAVNGLYIFNEVKESFSLYREISQPSMNYCILDIAEGTEIPEGWVLTDYELNGNIVKALVNKDKSYCMFYGISSNGETGWFLYRAADKTIQKNDDIAINAVVEADADADAGNDKKDDKRILGIEFESFIIMAALLGLILIAVIIICVLGIKVKKNSRKTSEKDGKSYYSFDTDESTDNYSDDENYNEDDLDDDILEVEFSDDDLSEDDGKNK